MYCADNVRDRFKDTIQSWNGATIVNGMLIGRDELRFAVAVNVNIVGVDKKSLSGDGQFDWFMQWFVYPTSNNMVVVAGLGLGVYLKEMRHIVVMDYDIGSGWCS